jgi:class 3 adenylate cyclase
LAEKLQRDGRRLGETDTVEVSVLMSDVRGYSGIAERADPTVLAHQLNEHRAAMNEAILTREGTVMQFVGDAVMAVFGAPFPQPDHADRAVAAATAMHQAQTGVNAGWAGAGLPPFILGIGVSTGKAAAALLGSEERLEYTIVGDTVNMAQRLCDLARPGDCTVVSDATWAALTARPALGTRMDEVLVKGREAPVRAWMLEGSK